MLRIIMDDLEPGEVAAFYEEPGAAVILVNRHLPDDERCDAVNAILARRERNPSCPNLPLIAV
jgi:hypothetical protein